MFSNKVKNAKEAKISITAFHHFTPTTILTNWSMSNGKLKWRQFSPCHNIHIHSTSIDLVSVPPVGLKESMPKWWHISNHYNVIFKENFLNGCRKFLWFARICWVFRVRVIYFKCRDGQAFGFKVCKMRSFTNLRGVKLKYFWKILGV